MGLFFNISNNNIINEVTIKGKELGFTYDIELASRTTGHIRVKVVRRLKKSKKALVSIGMDKGKIRMFHTDDLFNNLSRKEQERIKKFVEINWDIICACYTQNLDQTVAASMIRQRVSQYNNECIKNGRKGETI